MGQFANRPDFAVTARELALVSDETLDNEALYVGVSGDLEVILQNDTTSVTFTAVDVGFFPCIVKEVKTAGTTATDLIALQ